MRLFISAVITLTVGYFEIGAINREIHRANINQLLNR